MKHLTLFKSLFLIVTLFTVTSCDSHQDEQVTTEKELLQNDTVALTAEPSRPEPTFFIIPKELVKQRVWIIEDGKSDLFHMEHDCPVLVAGKGKGSFRNVTLPRAIEEYKRYNCQECSKELDHIFDEDMIRMSK
jgi:molybdopterin-guanine dinucleotide biosynthesis protein A